MYVDDLTTSMPDVDSAYAFYQRGVEKLLEAGFKLRKFMTNSVSLYTKLCGGKGTPTRKYEEKANQPPV